MQSLIRRWLVLVEMAGDALIVNAAFLAAFWLRFGGFPEENFPSFQKVYPYITISVIAVYAIYDLYAVDSSWSNRFYSLFTSNLVLLFVGIAVSFVLRGFALPRTIFAMAFALQAVLSTGWRYLTWVWASRAHRPHRLLIVAGEAETRHYLEALELNGPVESVVMSPREADNAATALIGPMNSRAFAVSDASRALTGDPLAELIRQVSPDQIIIGSDVDAELRRDLVILAASQGVTVALAPDSYDLLVLGAKTMLVGDNLFFEIQAMGGGQSLLKRVIDLVVAMSGLILLWPVMLLIAPAIKLDSPGPVFYTQIRVGLAGKEFRLYKFRSMVQHAEKNTGPTLSTKGDPRQTRVGRILRATRLDELPQLVNVIKGEMSIVGPRPERPSFAARFEHDIPGYRFRYTVVPGLTGPAQVYGHYSTPAREKLRFDLLYARTRTRINDLKIILLTLKTIMKREGS